VVLLAGVFGVGVIGGFVWSLLQRRPDSDYRDNLERDRHTD